MRHYGVQSRLGGQYLLRWLSDVTNVINAAHKPETLEQQTLKHHQLLHFSVETLYFLLIEIVKS